MQVNNQEVGFLRVKDIPGVQRTLQESFLIVRGAFERWLTEAPNYLHSPEQLLAEENCNEQMPAAFLWVQSGSKFELNYRNAMLESTSHKQMKICLQDFVQYVLE